MKHFAWRLPRLIALTTLYIRLSSPIQFVNSCQPKVSNSWSPSIGPFSSLSKFLRPKLKMITRCRNSNFHESSLIPVASSTSRIPDKISFPSRKTKKVDNVTKSDLTPQESASPKRRRSQKKQESQESYSDISRSALEVKIDASCESEGDSPRPNRTSTTLKKKNIESGSLTPPKGSQFAFKRLIRHSSW